MCGSISCFSEMKSLIFSIIGFDLFISLLEVFLCPWFPFEIQRFSVSVISFIRFWISPNREETVCISLFQDLSSLFNSSKETWHIFWCNVCYIDQCWPLFFRHGRCFFSLHPLWCLTSFNVLFGDFYPIYMGIWTSHSFTGILNFEFLFNRLISCYRNSLFNQRWLSFMSILHPAYMVELAESDSWFTWFLSFKWRKTKVYSVFLNKGVELMVQESDKLFLFYPLFPSPATNCFGSTKSITRTEWRFCPLEPLPWTWQCSCVLFSNHGSASCCSICFHSCCSSFFSTLDLFWNPVPWSY